MKRAATLSDLRAPRALTLEDGVPVARRRSSQVDDALRELTGDALGTTGGIAVVAQGGYGREELAPFSDIDVLFVVGTANETTQGTLRSILYPLYDAGLKVGHATVTPKQAILRSESDLHATTALLSARLVAGDENLFADLQNRFARWLKRRAKAIARAVSVGVDERHLRTERAGWLLAPNLKEDAGGLRDIHAAGWLAELGAAAEDLDLERERSTLVAAREALHLEVGRQLDVLRIDLQPAVARRLGFDGEDAADRLMLEVHRAARDIEHRTALFRAEAIRAIFGGPRRSGSVHSVAPGVRLEDGDLRVTPEGARDVPTALRLVTAAAVLQKPLDRKAHQVVVDAFGAGLEWDERTRSAFFDLLRSERSAAALEAIDHARGWDTLIPEWNDIRGRAQHDPYHRFTVDAHSFVVIEQIAQVLQHDPLARAAADEAGDLNDLYLAALLHDVGKGSGIDHSVAGEKIARTVCGRMRLDDQTTVPRLVRHHLLLADTATRRDIDDGNVIDATARAIEDPRALRLLYILTAADSQATGPEAWGPWKAALVASLYRKTLTALETGELPQRSDVAAKVAELEAYEPALTGRTAEILATLPESYLESEIWDMADEIALVARPPGAGEVRHRLRDGAQPGHSVMTLCVADRPGALARSAGVFALHRAPVLAAQAYSTCEGAALQRFDVRMRIDDPRWEQLIADLDAVYGGRLAIAARVERKASDYRPATSVRADVRILNDASEHSTVIEVRATDAVGLLYAVTSAIAELDLDIHSAKVDTLGERVVDAFYIRTPWGTKLEPSQAGEVVDAIQHRVARFFDG